MKTKFTFLSAKSGNEIEKISRETDQTVKPFHSL